MDTTGILMGISQTIANHPGLEVILSITIIGWLAGAWVLRRSASKPDG